MLMVEWWTHGRERLIGSEERSDDERQKLLQNGIDGLEVEFCQRKLKITGWKVVFQNGVIEMYVEDLGPIIINYWDDYC